MEEAGATFHNIRTGKELKSGTRAVIKRKDVTSFREFTLSVHDFALLFDKDGKALNPPEIPGSHDDPGIMEINYRSESMRERLNNDSDPAYIFSSLVHGDPATPILKTYPRDEIMIRLLDGAHEEQHAFNLQACPGKKSLLTFFHRIPISRQSGFPKPLISGLPKHILQKIISITLEGLMIHGWGYGESSEHMNAPEKA